MARFIAITGTHSTGKSTFLNSLEQALLEHNPSLRIARVADKASDCRDAGFPILRDHTVDSTLWIMASVIRAELEAAQSADVVLVDRPVSDALGYMEAAFHIRGEQVPPVGRRYLYAVARHHSCRYDQLVRTILDGGVPLGAGRDRDLGFRALVHEKLESVVAEIGADCLTLKANTTESTLARLVGD